MHSIQSDPDRQRTSRNKSMRKQVDQSGGESAVTVVEAGPASFFKEKNTFLIGKSRYRANNQETALASCGRYFRRLAYATVEKGTVLDTR